MSKILMICTGGTLSMVPGENGVLAPAAPEEFMRILHREIPALHAVGMPTIESTIYDPLLDSSQMTITDWNKIARDIGDQYDNYDGFVILHGTDTMAYTGSALSFMLQGLSKPVILTGAQVPLSSPNNDARSNITNAIRVAGNCPELHEVVIYFDGQLLRANRAIKSSTTSLKAFTSPNYPLLGYIDHRNNIHLNRHRLLQNGGPDQKLKITLLNTSAPKIRFFRVEPSFDENWLEQTLTGADVVILQTLGDGNMPINKNIIALLKKASEDGVILINRSQCLESNTESGMYASGAALASCNIISAGGQTEETIRAKLCYLFTQGFSAKAIRGLLIHDMFGELALPSVATNEQQLSPLSFFQSPDRKTPNTNGSNTLSDEVPSPFSNGCPASSFHYSVTGYGTLD